MTLSPDTVERIARIAFGAALMAAAASDAIGFGGWIGVVPLATGLLRQGPAFLPFRLETAQTPRAAPGR